MEIGVNVKKGEIKGKNRQQIVNIGVREVQENLELYLYTQIKDHPKRYKDIVVVCVGTDRSTGDSLGPLVGTKLQKREELESKVKLYGTLHEPVHAQNLMTKLDQIDHEGSLVICVDASLGTKNNIGNLVVKTGQLNPGSGVGKTLRAFGDITITGVVNIGGHMEYMVLQNTRLAVVYEMAEVIEKAIYSVLGWIKTEREIDAKNMEINKTIKREIANYGGAIVEGELKVAEILERKLVLENITDKR